MHNPLITIEIICLRQKVTKDTKEIKEIVTKVTKEIKLANIKIVIFWLQK